MPTKIERHRINFSGEGAPVNATGFTSLQNKDTYTDVLTGKTYVWNVSVWTEKKVFGTGEKGDKGDTGPQGPPGNPGTGGFSPFITVQPNGTNDTTALVNAIEEQRINFKPIILAGNYKVDSGKLKFKRDHKRPTIIGGILNCLDNTAGAVIGSDFPTSTADAEFYVERIYEIRNVTINCGSNQIGIAPGPNKGSIFEGNLINGGAAGLYNRFALNGTANRNEFLGQAYPTVTAHGGVLPLPGILANYGSWPDATVANSCSNVFTFNHNRVYSNGNTVYANSCFASDGVYYYDGINEGHKITWDYFIHALESTTAKRWGVIRTHHESVVPLTNIATEGMVYCRAPSGQLDVENPLGHYGAIMVNAGGTVGTLNVTVSKNQWWVPIGNKWWFNGSTGNTAWEIEYIENLGSDPSIIPSLFTGIPVKVVPPNTVNPGNNSVVFIPIPR